MSVIVKALGAALSRIGLLLAAPSATRKAGRSVRSS